MLIPIKSFLYELLVNIVSTLLLDLLHLVVDLMSSRSVVTLFQFL
jgi:hypothetical protein